MTDKDIIQVLQYIVENGSGACDKCPVFPCGKIKDYEDNQCGRFIAENALDLINRQKAEIERLKEENQKLNLMIEAIDDYISPLPFKTDFDNAIETAKSEAIKEFTEKLKYIITLNNTNDSYLDYSVDYNCLMEDIDELVNEMESENNV